MIRSGKAGFVLAAVAAGGIACGRDGTAPNRSITPPASFSILSGGNNVPERFSSDLWLQGDYAYTGTWGGAARTSNNNRGNALKVWRLDATGAPSLVDSIVISGVVNVSDVEVSADGLWLVFTTEGGANAGLEVYSLANPALPSFVANFLVSTGLHTGSLATINGKLYAFGAKNPGAPALMVFDLSAAISGAGPITVAAQVAIPPAYGIHDTFVRDGLAFVCAWDTGIIIYDVGNGLRGGSPAAPAEVSRIAISGGAAHNAWWFNNPVRGEQRYLFVGQEGPGAVGARSSGDIFVLDVSDLSRPAVVATYHQTGAGTHNFWMDESAEVLYAAYYNGGVVALDVSGTLSGNLANREIARSRPGGAGNTYVWGVHLHNGSLYAIDMLSGLWQLSMPQ